MKQGKRVKKREGFHSELGAHGTVFCLSRFSRAFPFPFPYLHFIPLNTDHFGGRQIQ